MNSVIRHLRRGAWIGLTDRELLEALVTRRDESAFEAILRRHGSMVLAVCRRGLRNADDAEDAFQATFLVLIRKASSIRKRDALGSWLYGVAYRTAQKAHAMNAKRRVKERQAETRPQNDGNATNADLDLALNALPEKYRVPIVLCELEGRSRKSVARELAIAEGTLSSRLATARSMLAKRLRGGHVMAPAVSGVPVLLTTSTVKAAGQVLAGQALKGLVSAQVIALSEGVTRAMFVNKLKALTTVLVFLGALGVGSGQLTQLAVDGAASAAEGQPNTARVEQAAADLSAAQAELKQVESQLAAARARLLQKEAAFLDASQCPATKAEVSALALAIANRFKYRVPIEIGATEFKEGGRIEILEVWGTRPRIEVGGQYVVRGKYVLPRGERGTLYFYETAEGNWGLTPTANLDLQSTAVDKQEGEFTLVHSMAGPGYFHLYLAAAERYSRTFANVYFGTGDNVLRKKSW